jgi:2,3-bisphosphoglycerate-independent phosphoglycerate mutase
MKTVVVLYDGMADRPVQALDGRTPLQAARCSVATSLAVSGRGGVFAPLRKENDNRPETRLALAWGQDKETARALARGPLEALGAGLDIPDGATVYRADFVTLDDDTLHAPEVARLSREETETLAAVAQSCWDRDAVRIEVVGPGRALVVANGFAADNGLAAPPAIMQGEPLPERAGKKNKESFSLKFLYRSYEALSGHPINQVRVDLGENPAHALWLWGGGTMPAFARRRDDSAVLTNSLMARGLALWLGMKPLELSDLWREDGKRKAGFKLPELVQVLRERDQLMVYVEARNAIGRYGSAEEKVWALETLDHYLLGPLMTLLEANKPYRIVLGSDGMVRTATERPLAEPVPFVLNGADVEPDAVAHWDEEACEHGALGARKWADIERLMLE